MLLLDSAMIEDAHQAARLGFVAGATTNPALLARAGRPADQVLPQLADILGGIVFHQLVAPTVEARLAEAHRLLEGPFRDRYDLGFKIPCTPENLSLAAQLATEGIPVGLTAIFSAAQVYLACELGVSYVLPYVNRTTRLQGSGPALVRQMRSVIDALQSPLEIIAASIKTPAEAVEAVLAGAHHLTLPLSVILAMAEHPLSEQAIQEFAAHCSEQTSG